MRYTLGLLLIFLVSACRVDSETVRTIEPLPISITGRGDAATVAKILTQDLASRDVDGRIVSEGGGLVVTLVLQAGGAEGSYKLAGDAGAYTVTAPDKLGLQYGAYDLVERAGVVLVHPEETIFPDALCVSCVGSVNETHTPSYTMRGTHVHTMHPLEYEETLLGSDPGNLPRFRKFIGWLIARRQNYLQWALLRTIDGDRWIAYAKDMAAIAHERGFYLGISAPIAFRQQNSFFLYDSESPTPATTQMAANIDWLMQVPWDRINVEMGASEFLPVSDVDQVHWLDFLAAYLDANYPGVRTATKIHSSTNQTAETYGGNFNYIVKYASLRVGAMPHTVQWYDLYRTAPTYDRKDFADMREFLLGEVGKREVFYYPETAYWVTFDVDIPLFLPQYVYSRWNDLHNLRDTGMDGQINFSSGFEWGFWLNDFGSSWHAYDAGSDYLAPVRRAFTIFGGAQQAALTVFDEYVNYQGAELLEMNGIRWLIGWDAADDFGHFVDIHAQPVAKRLYEVAKMSAADAAAFEAAELPQLATMADELARYAAAWERVGQWVPASSRRIHREFQLGMRMNALRARYMLALYEAVAARAQGDAARDTANLAAAERTRAAALELANAQTVTYRFPFDEIAVDRTSRTSYPFGYLRTVPDLWYWGREMEMAVDPEGYDFLYALYDLVESAGL